jgi:plasmid stabilization system protein ParE
VSGASLSKKQKLAVRLTANFERDLESIERFLIENHASRAFDLLVDELLDKTIPNLERFPGIGAAFLELPANSTESLSALEALKRKTDGVLVRQYVMVYYLLLYAVSADGVHLLSIKQHQQLSFDLDVMWLAGLHR